MNGDDFSALLEDYHYGELDDVTAARFMTHLRGCDNCSSMLRELERENQVYQAYADSIERNLDVTPAMWEGVLVRMTEVTPDASTRQGLFGRLRQSLSAVAAALLPTSPVMRQAAFAAVIIVISVAGTLLAVKLMEKKQPSIAGTVEQKQPAPISVAPSQQPAPENN